MDDARSFDAGLAPPAAADLVRKALKIWKTDLAILLAYALITLAFTYPLIARLGSSLYGHELVGFNPDPYAEMARFRAARQFFLDHHRLTFSPFIHPLVAYPGALLTGLADEVVAYNLLLLVSFPLAGFFTYRLALHLTGNRLASFYGGLLYAFCPYHWVHAYYHLSLAHVQWFPLYLLALFVFTEKASPDRGLLLTAALFLLLFTNYYYALLALVLTFIFLAWRGAYLFLLKNRNTGETRSYWILVSLLAWGALCFLGIFWENLYLIYTQRPSFSARTGDLFRYASRPWGFIFPPLDNPVLGWIGRDYILSRLEGGTLVEHTLYPGLTPLLLSLAALWGWLKKEKMPCIEKPGFTVPFLWLLLTGGIVFSLPPVIFLGEFRLFLPSYFLYPILPMFRAYARFGLLVYLGLALLAAAGLNRLIQGRRKTWWVPALAFGLLLIEYTNLPPWRNRPVLPLTERSLLLMTLPASRRGLSLKPPADYPTPPVRRNSRPGPAIPGQTP